MTTIARHSRETGFRSIADETQFYESHAKSVTESGPKKSRSKQLAHRSNDFRRKGNEDFLEAAEAREMADVHRRSNNPEGARAADARAALLTVRAKSRIRRADAVYREAMGAKTLMDWVKAGGLQFFVGINTLSVVVGLLCTPIQNKQLDEINENIKRLARARAHDRAAQATALVPTPSFTGPLSYVV